MLNNKEFTRLNDDKSIMIHKYENKKFSILGDSISTLVDFIPNNYKPFYNESNCAKADIHSVNDTWWGNVVSFFGGEMLANSSYSGSKVTSNDGEFPCINSEERINALSQNGQNPDVIILYAGFNDWAKGMPLKAVNDGRALTEFFDYSYLNLVIKITKSYPNAEIWCCTLCQTKMSSNPKFVFPFERFKTHIEKFNDVIRSVANRDNCKLLDLYDYGIPVDTIDSSHPNAEGMQTLADLVCRSIVESTEIVVEECSDNEHDFALFEEVTGGSTYECSICKKEVTVFSVPDGKHVLKNYIGSRFEGRTIDSNWFNNSDNDKTEEELNLCPNCNAPVEFGYKFCIKCGTKLITEDKPNDEPKQELEIIDNRYELVRQVGKGASSIVYLAKDTKLDRVCAVKVVDKNTYANKMAAEESLNEANKLKSLAHISIPQLYDIYNDENRLCIVLEYIEGKTLKQVINSTKEPINEKTIVSWAKQICSVLFYLHTLQPARIYRDLKPANIILQPNGIIKLIDFGTMKCYDDSVAEDTVNIGTKGYAAPESFGGRGATDARTDIYSLGMTLYHLITGISPASPPFEIKPFSSYRDDISKELEKIVMKCIAVDREERFQTAMEVYYELSKIG